MKMCMGETIRSPEAAEASKCQRCNHLVRGEAEKEDAVKEWYAKPAMPCKCFKPMEAK